MQAITFNDFSGGIADQYLSSVNRHSHKLENLSLDENGNPYTRWGVKALATRINAADGVSRITGIYLGSEPFDHPFFFKNNEIYRYGPVPPATDDVFTELTGSNGNACLDKQSNTFEQVEVWKKQLIYAFPGLRSVVTQELSTLPCRLYCSSLANRTYALQTLGLPALASTPTATAGTVGTTFTYIYAFHYYYTWTDYQNVTWEEKGPVTTLTATAANAIAAGVANTMSLASIPALANTSYSNWIVSTSLKIRISRTLNNGTTFYFLADVNNGTTTYSDTTTDATIDDNDTIYTDGGKLDYNPPPTGSIYLTQVNDFFWFATERILTHSIQGAPGACPDEYQQTVDQKIKGLSSTIAFPILFCEKSIYRVEGVFDEFGDGGFDLREIHATAGCQGTRSIVRVPGGIVWPGNGAFYFTNGYECREISKGLRRLTFQDWAGPNMVGAYDSRRNVVVWTTPKELTGAYVRNDQIAVLHLDQGFGDGHGSFTTFRWPDNIFPSCVAFTETEDITARTYANKVLIGDDNGYMFYQAENAWSDPWVEPSVAIASWRKKAIIYRWESLGFDLGDDSHRKFSSHITAELEIETAAAVKFESRIDDGGAWGSLSEYRHDGPIIWGQTEVPWNSSTDPDEHRWNSIPLLDGKRAFPQGKPRSSRRQLAMTNAKPFVARSDNTTTATVTAGAYWKRVTLDSASFKFPQDCDEFEIAFDTDSYATYYTVKERISNTALDVHDPLGTLTLTAGKKWQMRGVRKDERVKLLSVSVHSLIEPDSQHANRGNSSYVNA